MKTDLIDHSYAALAASDKRPRPQRWPGRLIGALVIQSLQSGMVLLGLDSAFQQMVVGLVLVGAVGIDTFYRRRTAKG